jgi:hypothetical protein
MDILPEVTPSQKNAAAAAAAFLSYVNGLYSKAGVTAGGQLIPAVCSQNAACRTEHL